MNFRLNYFLKAGIKSFSILSSKIAIFSKLWNSEFTNSKVGSSTLVLRTLRHFKSEFAQSHILLALKIAVFKFKNNFQPEKKSKCVQNFECATIRKLFSLFKMLGYLTARSFGCPKTVFTYDRKCPSLRFYRPLFRFRPKFRNFYLFLCRFLIGWNNVTTQFKVFKIYSVI